MTVTATVSLRDLAVTELVKVARANGRTLDESTVTVQEVAPAYGERLGTQLLASGRTTAAEPIPMPPCRGCLRPRSTREAVGIFDWGASPDGSTHVEANGFCFACNKLRDKFAGQAIPAIVGPGGLAGTNLVGWAAAQCWGLADAMLAERAKVPQGRA